MAVQKRSSTDNVVFSGLSDARRRRILRLLTDRSSAVPVRELATHLVALENDKALVGATEDEVERLMIDLVHTQLPKLAEADLLTWNEREGTVNTTEHPALPDPKLQRIVSTETSGWDAVLSNLANKRRRVVLSVLKDAGAPMTHSELAREVAVRDASGGQRPVEAAAEISLRLQHVHLPKLEAAGLVDHDADDETVTYEGHPELDDEWLDTQREDLPTEIPL